jgi:hypothetical protein
MNQFHVGTFQGEEVAIGVRGLRRVFHLYRLYHITTPFAPCLSHQLEFASGGTTKKHHRFTLTGDSVFAEIGGNLRRQRQAKSGSARLYPPAHSQP